VTLGDQTHKLPEPFMVFATQNPIDRRAPTPCRRRRWTASSSRSGSDYPKAEEERAILDRMAGLELPPVARVMSHEAVQRMADRVLASTWTSASATTFVASFALDPDTEGRGARRGRAPHRVRCIPRATLAFSHAARAMAFLQGRGFVIPEDVKAVGSRRAPPSDPSHLRGRGGGRHQRAARRAAARSGRGAMRPGQRARVRGSLGAG